MGYFKLPDDIIDKHGKKLGLSGIGLYTYLARRADKGGSSFPSLRTIASDTGTGSTNTVSRYLAILKALFLLKINRVSHGKHTKLVYQILIQPVSKNEIGVYQNLRNKEYTYKENTLKERNIKVLKKDGSKAIKVGNKWVRPEDTNIELDTSYYPELRSK